MRSATAVLRLRINQRMSTRTSVMRGVIRMIRKLTVALAATAVVGTAALAPSAANATWRGYGWYGHSYYSYPGYAYGPGYFYKPHYLYPRYFHRKHAGWWNYRYNY